MTAKMTHEERLDEQDTVKEYTMQLDTNALKYECFFKDFCSFQENDIVMMRATKESLAFGIKKWYGGLDNEVLSNLIFNFLSNHKHNYLIKFSEFVSFCVQFNSDPGVRNKIVFYMITDKNLSMKSTHLLRLFVKVPKGSMFSEELMRLIKYLTSQISKRKRQDVTLTFEDYQSITGEESCLAKELKFLLHDQVMAAFTEEGKLVKKFQPSASSVMHAGRCKIRASNIYEQFTINKWGKLVKSLKYYDGEELIRKKAKLF